MEPLPEGAERPANEAWAAQRRAGAASMEPLPEERSDVSGPPMTVDPLGPQWSRSRRSGATGSKVNVSDRNS